MVKPNNLVTLELELSVKQTLDILIVYIDCSNSKFLIASTSSLRQRFCASEIKIKPVSLTTVKILRKGKAYSAVSASKSSSMILSPGKQ